MNNPKSVLADTRTDGSFLLVAMLVLALAARVAYVWAHPFLYDDAYITFRYAENIARGNGYVYNVGEPVFGASSPLHVLLLATLAAVVSKETLPNISQWLGSAFLVAAVALFWRYLPLSRIVKVVVALGLLSAPRIFYASVGGMEECLILLLMGLSVIALIKRSSIWQGVVCGLLFVAKIDALVWVFCILIAATVIEKDFPWRVIVVGVVVAAPWIVYSLSAFGTLIPHAAIAKQIASHRADIHLSDALMLAVPNGFRDNGWAIAFFAASTFGAIGSALWVGAKRRDWIFLVFPIYCILYTVVLLTSRVPFVLWDRWTAPLWGALVVSFGYILQRLLPRAVATLEMMSCRKTYVLSLSLLCIALAGPYVYSRHASPDPVLSREVGQLLKDHADSSASVFLEPIGLIGYVSNFYIHDFIGLVSPRVSEARRQSLYSDRWFTAYLKQHVPTYVVLRAHEFYANQFGFGGGYGDGIFTNAEREWFTSNYREVFESSHGPERERFVIFRFVRNNG
jgi:hypothetical protein